MIRRAGIGAGRRERIFALDLVNLPFVGVTTRIPIHVFIRRGLGRGLDSVFPAPIRHQIEALCLRPPRLDQVSSIIDPL